MILSRKRYFSTHRIPNPMMLPACDAVLLSVQS
jgi:hypothetical protein